MTLDNADVVVFSRIDAGERGGIRISSIMRRRSSEERERGFELSIRDERGFDSRCSEDYNLCQGEHASSAEEFEGIRANAAAFLASLAS